MIDQLIPKPDKPAWPGPLEGGLTQSLLNTWIDSPFRAYLQLICGLKEHEDPHPNLIWGDAFHVGLEHLVEGQGVEAAQTAAIEYLYKTYPLEHIPESYQYTIEGLLEMYIIPPRKWQSELDIYKPHTLPSGSKVSIRGKVDGINLPYLLEHKCKGRIGEGTFTHITDYEVPDDLSIDHLTGSFAELPWDLQVNLYSYVTGCTKVCYDIIRIPEATYGLSKRKVAQPVRDYVNDLFYKPNTYNANLWPISTHKPDWIMQTGFNLPQENIDFVIKRQFEPIAQKIVNWYEYVTDSSFDPNNPEHYNTDFFMMPIRRFDASSTLNYKCRFHDFLTGELDICELQTIKSFYPELQSEKPCQEA